MTDSMEEKKGELQAVEAAIVDESKALESLKLSVVEAREATQREIASIEKDGKKSSDAHLARVAKFKSEISELEDSLESLKSEKKTVLDSLDNLNETVLARKDDVKVIEDSIEELSDEKERLVVNIKDHENALGVVKEKIKKDNVALLEKDEAVKSIDRDIAVKKAALEEEEAKVEQVQSRLVGLIGKEEKITKLIPEITELYRKAGVELEL
jgi:chromosome segregation ATPase